VHLFLLFPFPHRAHQLSTSTLAPVAPPPGGAAHALSVKATPPPPLSTGENTGGAPFSLTFSRSLLTLPSFYLASNLKCMLSLLPCLKARADSSIPTVAFLSSPLLDNSTSHRLFTFLADLLLSNPPPADTPPSVETAVKVESFLEKLAVWQKSPVPNDEDETVAHKWSYSHGAMGATKQSANSLLGTYAYLGMAEKVVNALAIVLSLAERSALDRVKAIKKGFWEGREDGEDEEGAKASKALDVLEEMAKKLLEGMVRGRGEVRTCYFLFESFLTLTVILPAGTVNWQEDPSCRYTKNRLEACCSG
jgi:hypothetical protein